VRGARGSRGGALALAWVAIVLLFWFGLFVPAQRPGLRRPMDADLWGYFHPKMWWSSVEIDAGRLPLWNPYEFGGLPLLGMAQPAAAYPLRQLAFDFFPGAALDAYMVLHYVLAGVFAFAAFGPLGLAPPGRAVATAAWVFSALNLESHYHPNRLAPLAWVPLLFALFVRSLERPGPRTAGGFGLVAAMTLLAGYPEYLLDAAICLVVFWPLAARALGGWPGGAARTLGWLAVAAGVGAALAGLQLGTVLQAAAESTRAAGGAGPGAEVLAIVDAALPTWHAKLLGLLTSFGRTFAMPAVVWALVVTGAVAGRARFRPAFLVVLVLAGVLASPLHYALADLPVFRLLRSNYVWVSLGLLPLAYLAGAGVDVLARGVAPPPAWHARAVAGAVLLALSLPWLEARGLFWLALTGALLVVARRGARGGGIARAAVPIVVVLALWTWIPPAIAGPTLHRFARGEPAFPPEPPRRSELLNAVRTLCGDAPQRVLAPWRTWDGTPLIDQVEMVQGYPEPLVPRRITRVLTALGAPPDTSFGKDVPEVLQGRRWLDLLNVGCVVVPRAERLDAPALDLQRRGVAGAEVVYRRRTLPRAFVVPEAVAVPDEEAAWRAVTAPGFDPRRTVIVESRTAPAGGGRGRADVLLFEPGRVTVRVATGRPAVLVVSQAGSPGWEASVDGRPAPVLQADYLIQAVAVPGGRHEVTLRYRPLAARLGWLAQVLGLAGLVVLARRDPA
jgi:hypothetical protein